jgi:hypothetical protein
LHWSWLNEVHSDSDVKKCPKPQDTYGVTVTKMTFDLTKPLAMRAA